jgi:hypothetical protein
MSSYREIPGKTAPYLASFIDTLSIRDEVSVSVIVTGIEWKQK